MNKVSLFVCGCVPILLSGCMPGIFQYDRGNPVVMSSLQHGATRQSVVDAAGPPLDSMELPRIGGVCFNYMLRNKANTLPYYVAFNAQGRVVNTGYVTCGKAAASGYLNSSAPLQQRY